MKEQKGFVFYLSIAGSILGAIMTGIVLLGLVRTSDNKDVNLSGDVRNIAEKTAQNTQDIQRNTNDIQSFTHKQIEMGSDLKHLKANVDLINNKLDRLIERG